MIARKSARAPREHDDSRARVQAAERLGAAPPHVWASAGAYALDLELHPVGQIGEADVTGTAAQGLKLTNSDADTAGSAAIIRGAEGVPVRYITSLAYDYRKDGRCSKTDPRWTLFIPATPEEWAAIQDPVEAAP